MNLEGITLYALTTYLKREITGSRISKIGMPSNHSICFSLKRELDVIHLMIDVNGGSPAVYTADKAPENPPEPPAFCMLLRKHLEEGKITQIKQYGLDRVIELEISLLGRSSRIITKQIVMELTGKNANLIFAENGIILDSIKHVSPVMNSVRVIQPGYAYNPPPLQTGLNILTASPEAIVAAIPDEVTGSLWKQLVTATTGIGKASALQLLSVANIPLNATYLTPMDRKQLVSVIAGLQKAVTDNTAVQAFTAVISKNNQCQTIFPFPVSYIPEDCRTEIFQTINEALCYASLLQPAKRPEQELLQKTVLAEIRTAENKIRALQQDLSHSNEADTYRIMADSLTAALYQIQKGTESCTVTNIYDGTPLQIALSPVLTPAGNAQKYYKKYNKLKRAQEEVAVQLAEATDLRTWLESVKKACISQQPGRKRKKLEKSCKKQESCPPPSGKHRPPANLPLCKSFFLKQPKSISVKTIAKMRK